MIRRSQSQKLGGRAFQAEERTSAKTLRWAEFGMSKNKYIASVLAMWQRGRRAGKTKAL